jgi:multicomponent Na+:H+ antiporter subunit C
MNLVFSLTVAVLVATGAHLLLKHDLIRVVAGTVLISYGANLFIMAAGLSRGRAPILPLADNETVSDPLVQAMTLTAIVISFGVTALLLSLIYRVYAAHRTLDTEELAEVEEAEELRTEDAVEGTEDEDAAILLRTEAER